MKTINLKKGDKLYIEDIKIKLPTGNEYTLNPILFRII